MTMAQNSCHTLHSLCFSECMISLPHSKIPKSGFRLPPCPSSFIRNCAHFPKQVVARQGNENNSNPRELKSEARKDLEFRLEKSEEADATGITRRETLFVPLIAFGVLGALPLPAKSENESALKQAEQEPLKPKTQGMTNPNKAISRIYDATAIGEPVAIGKDRSKVWNRLLGARIIYLGEAENVPDPDDKVIELEIVKGILDNSTKQNLPVSLALQSFPCNLQPQLDQYMRKGINDDDLKSLVSHWSAEQWKEYQPLLHYCRENEVHLIACGAPIEIMRIVESKGVQGLTMVQRKKFVPASGVGFIADSLYVSRRLSLQNILQQSSSPFVPASYLSAEAHAVEDYTMSQIITSALTHGRSVGLLIVIAGASHVLLGCRGSGLPARVSKKIPKKSQVVILLNPERQHIRKEGDVSVADYLWYSSAKPCTRNCFDRVEIARIMGAASKRRDTLPQDIQKGLDLGLIPPDVLQNFLDLEQNPFVANLIHRFQGFRERWLANPRILQRLALEESICISTTFMAQYKKRKEHFMKELNYVISDTLRSTVVSFFAVWLPAPTLSFISFEENVNSITKDVGIKGLLGSLPDNAFQGNPPGKNWDIKARVISVVVGGVKLFGVGFVSSVATLSIANALFSMQRQWDKNIKHGSIRLQSPVLKTALVYGFFLATSGNLRYQFVAGVIEYWIADCLLISQPLLGDILSFASRIINSYFGTQQWVDLARFTGLQRNTNSQEVQTNASNIFVAEENKSKLPSTKEGCGGDGKKAVTVLIRLDC